MDDARSGHRALSLPMIWNASAQKNKRMRHKFPDTTIAETQKGKKTTKEKRNKKKKKRSHAHLCSLFGRVNPAMIGFVGEELAAARDGLDRRVIQGVQVGCVMVVLGLA